VYVADYTTKVTEVPHARQTDVSSAFPNCPVDTLQCRSEDGSIIAIKPLSWSTVWTCKLLFPELLQIKPDSPKENFW